MGDKNYKKEKKKKKAADKPSIQSSVITPTTPENKSKK